MGPRFHLWCFKPASSSWWTQSQEQALSTWNCDPKTNITRMVMSALSLLSIIVTFPLSLVLIIVLVDAVVVMIREGSHTGLAVVLTRSLTPNCSACTLGCSDHRDLHSCSYCTPAHRLAGSPTELKPASSGCGVHLQPLLCSQDALRKSFFLAMALVHLF